MSDTSTAKRTGKGKTKQAARKTRPRPAEAAETTGAARTTGPGHSLPILVPEVHVRHLPLPQVGIGHVPVPRVHLPVPEAVRGRVPDLANNRLVWYGGLAGLAAVGMIGWPVAGVVAAGVYVAEHRAQAAMRADGDGEHAADQEAGKRRTAAVARA